MAVEKLQPVTIDFETAAIEPRPNYPPRPCGVAIKYPGKKSRYYAFGHPTENNCTFEEAKQALALAWEWGDGILCHNLKFDYDVAMTHMGMSELPWEKLHDTMLLLFLDNPHADKLALKPSAERLLGMKPEEQDAVRDWLMANQPAENARVTKTNFGAHISLAPGRLVGTYADGDVTRTEKLFALLHASILKRRMGDAYDRERKLLPILLHIETQGIMLNQELLEHDVEQGEAIMLQTEKWLRKKMKNEEVNINSGQQLVRALSEAGLLDLDALGHTLSSTPEKPKYASGQADINAAITDPAVGAVLQYRSQLDTCLSTFMKPWLETAQQSEGRIFTNWNQIRNERSGARTGRFSSSPNFQNVPKAFKAIFKHDLDAAIAKEQNKENLDKLRVAQKKLPKAPFDLPPLPLCRRYVVPMRDDHVLLDRDYSQQEPRIFAHFEDGPLKDAYNEDPWLDLHDHAHKLINEMLGTDYPRKVIKTMDLGMLYGMGVGLLAQTAGIEVEQARQLRKAVLDIFPGLKELNADMKERAKTDQPLRTWGGREYFCEPPKMVDGRLMTFDYKMVNCLIQGSAADCTKQALIDYWETKSEEVFLLLTVHDEVLISAPSLMAGEAMDELRWAMNGIDFDVPMLSEGTIGLNWAEMRDYDKKGEEV